MSKLLLTLFACLLLLGPVQAQDSTAAQTRPAKETVPLKDRIWFGGGLGLSFGTVTAVQVDPMVGYFVDHDRKVSFGLGPSYNYFQDNRPKVPYSMSAYGYRLFGRFRPLQPIFLHAEFLHLNTEPYYYFDNNKGRIWVPHLLLGGGYVQSAGGNVAFYLQVLFEVLQDPNSFYVGQGPILSGGVGFGF